MTRVVAGTFKGRRLRTPPGDATRPTSDRVRESLFATLTSAFGGLDDLRVLDLFAGSGAIGIEALSRGAAHADLVDPDRHAVRVMRSNLDELAISTARVHPVKAAAFLRRPPLQPYDLIVLDPPYAVATAEVAALVGELADPVWCLPDGLIVVERSSRDPFTWPPGIEPYDERAYGETTLWYGR
ncbi:MAG: 16S rRNA (guanine(966)-N(2))-methyltransferase RsmD [Aeromicrobium sp.]|uniref:16S rRNA (guanine(966)-N(2))-methyltransferase RsmD n=1 Tax=Aeromicrobium sp. TaxID=1871063 RepID=UPI002639EC41|nr:16S rRNA (guanine(966)-N(2))-methyltransferase RsmD [Aeromicrobium sp.]MDF1703611.1 16S rRNA (guanine(966)-N(2))-methyltransferase RsmD [Aeromicrobium sp.]